MLFLKTNLSATYDVLAYTFPQNKILSIIYDMLAYAFPKHQTMIYFIPFVRTLSFWCHCK